MQPPNPVTCQVNMRGRGMTCARTRGVARCHWGIYRYFIRWKHMLQERHVNREQPGQRCRVAGSFRTVYFKLDLY